MNKTLLLLLLLVLVQGAGAAEILFKAVDNPDPMGYKRGDPVVIFENGHVWGSEELKVPNVGGLFVVIKITDVTVAQVRNFILTRWGFDILDLEPDQTARRRVRLDISAMPVSLRNALNRDGQYTTTWTAIRSFIKNRRTGETLQ